MTTTQPPRATSASPAALTRHVWQRCHGCGAQPILGTRHDCETCPAGPDNHLCDACFTNFLAGATAHPPAGSLAESIGVVAPHRFRAAAETTDTALDQWCTTPDAGGDAATIPSGFVVRPEFHTSRESTFGSYGFALARQNSGPLIVTALHVMDTLLHHVPINATASSLPQLITRVTLYDVFADPWIFAKVGTASEMLALPNARLGEEEPFCQNDIAAFVAQPSSRLRPAPLASALPKLGEPLWLVASQRPAPARTAGATVVEANERVLIYRFRPDAESPRYNSGAPLLNAAGEVVGINIGAGMLDGRRYGHAVHNVSMLRHLDC